MILVLKIVLLIIWKYILPGLNNPTKPALYMYLANTRFVPHSDIYNTFFITNDELSVYIGSTVQFTSDY
jgi:hypothetical protein